MTAQSDSSRARHPKRATSHGLRRLLLALAMSLVAGCSSVQFFYNQLDWLVPFYLETYVELDDRQRTYLEQQVESLLKWHCGTHLTDYAKLLRQANDDFQANRMDRERLLAISMQLERYWFEVMAESAPAIANLLLTATDEQIEELFESFEDKSEELREVIAERSAEDTREDYIERMSSELERWFGPLTESQQEATTLWSTQFVPLGEQALQTRQRWQGRLRELLAQRNDIPAFRQGIERLLLDVREFRTPGYQDRLDANRDATINLVESVGRSLTAAQRQHLAAQAERYAGDLEALSCAGRPAPESVDTQDGEVF